MKPASKASIIFLFCFIQFAAFGQEGLSDKEYVDIIWLKDGSKLTGTILEWDLSNGMDFQLVTGATITIGKDQIKRVSQNISPDAAFPVVIDRTVVQGPKPYRFREEGLYHNASIFLRVPTYSGSGIHYAIGHRFNRLLGVGIGMGYETHETTDGFFRLINFVPVYVEARGFLLPQKITPYYALKIGYGFALDDPFSEPSSSNGGIHFSPELGMRFGSGAVNFYAGLEYKIQDAKYFESWWGGGSSIEKISFRRLELRAGVLF